MLQFYFFWRQTQGFPRMFIKRKGPCKGHSAANRKKDPYKCFPPRRGELTNPWGKPQKSLKALDRSFSQTGIIRVPSYRIGKRIINETRIFYTKDYEQGGITITCRYDHFKAVKGRQWKFIHRIKTKENRDEYGLLLKSMNARITHKAAKRIHYTNYKYLLIIKKLNSRLKSRFPFSRNTPLSLKSIKGNAF